MAYISMFPPDSIHLSIRLYGDRTYTSMGGAPVEVEDFDVPMLQANGWTTATYEETLNTLAAPALSLPTFATASAQGTPISDIVSTTPGSTLSILSQSVTGALQLEEVDGVWQLQVGPTPPSSGTITFSLQETLPGATNSPHTTAGLSVTVTGTGGASMFNDPSYSAMVAAVAA